MNEQNSSALTAKQVADLLTYLRGFLALALVWLGLTQGAAALSMAVYLLLLSWTSDSLDGPMARRSSRVYQTWIGDHDLEIDMAVSGGLLVYLVAAGFLDPPAAALYAISWALIFWRWGLARSLGMLVQAPIYAWFIWVAVRDARSAGQWLIVWIIAAIIVTWPRFPNMVIPDFLSGMRSIWQHYQGSDD
jgi:phosphatidylglycerophosphate synthase